MKRYIAGADRNQSTLLPACLEDFVSDDNPVRVIDVFIDGLKLSKLGFDGALNRLQSSRRLEREAQRNVELMWLLRRLTPDFKTIADVRKDNGAAIRKVGREFRLASSKSKKALCVTSKSLTVPTVIQV